IGAQIAPGYAPESVAALAFRLKTLLQSKDVLVEITDLQRFEGSLPDFVNQFWNPLASHLSAEPPINQLVALITMEQAATGDLDPFLFDPATDEPEDFNAAKLIKLPELTVFEEDEIASWLVKRLQKDLACGNDPDQLAEVAKNLAETLFRET